GLQHRTKHRDETLYGPLALLGQRIDELCPAEVLADRFRTGGSVDAIAASGLADEIVCGPNLVFGIVVAQCDDTGRLVVLRPVRDKESIAAFLVRHWRVFLVFHYVLKPSASDERQSCLNGQSGRRKKQDGKSKFHSYLDSNLGP